MEKKTLLTNEDINNISRIKHELIIDDFSNPLSIASDITEIIINGRDIKPEILDFVNTNGASDLSEIRINGQDIKPEILHFVNTNLTFEIVSIILFHKYACFNSYTIDKTVEKYYRELCSSFLDRLKKGLTSCSNVDDCQLIYSETQRWIIHNDMVMYLVGQDYQDYRIDYNAFPEIDYSYISIHNLLSDLVSNTLYKYTSWHYPTITSEILYNYWGDNYASILKTIDRTLPLTDIEKSMIYDKDNQRLFYTKCKNLFRGSDYSDSIVSQNTLFFQELFKDYIRRIRKHKIGRKGLSLATNYWKRVTFNIMGRVLETGMIKENKCHFNYNMYKSCHDAVKDIVFGYIIQGMDSHHNNIDMEEWRDRIDFDRLYNKMTEEPNDSLDIQNKYYCFSASTVNQELFRESILKADVKVIFQSAASLKKTEYIYTFISELGYNIGDNWLTKAAESVTGLQDKLAIKRVRSHCREEIKELLSSHVRGYTERPLRKTAESN